MTLKELLSRLELHASEIRRLLSSNRHFWEARDPERVQRRVRKFLGIGLPSLEPEGRIVFDAEGGFRLVPSTN